MVQGVSPLLPSSSSSHRVSISISISVHGYASDDPRPHKLHLVSRFSSHLGCTFPTHKLPVRFSDRPSDLSPRRGIAFSGLRTARSITLSGCHRIVPVACSEFNDALPSPVAGSVEGVREGESISTEESPAVEGLLATRNATSMQVGSTVEAATIPTGDFARKETVPLEKGKGATIVDFLTVFERLLERPFGSGQAIAAAGGVVVERVNAEAEALREGGGVDDRAAFEFLRVLRLLEMDLQLLHAARKGETLMERLQAAKTHCKQAILIAAAF